MSPPPEFPFHAQQRQLDQIGVSSIFRLLPAGFPGLPHHSADLRQAYGLIDRPTMIIKLDCAPEIQLERIRRRGRGAELSITRSFLVELSANIDDFLDDSKKKAQGQAQDRGHQDRHGQEGFRSQSRGAEDRGLS